MTPPPPYRLVRDLVSHDTIDILSTLLEEARAGRVIGLALVAMRTRKRYELAITGELDRSPTFALGTVSKLQHDLAKRVNEDT